MKYSKVSNREKLKNYIGWFASEKLDGWNVRWTGTRFVTKNGTPCLGTPEMIDALRKHSPSTVLEGEMYLGSGLLRPKVATLCSCGRVPKGGKATFNVFDAPLVGKTFEERMEVAHRRVSKTPSCIRLVSQKRIRSPGQLVKMFEGIKRRGGEGIVVADPKGLYSASSTRQRSKVKLKELKGGSESPIKLPRGKLITPKKRGPHEKFNEFSPKGMKHRRYRTPSGKIYTCSPMRLINGESRKQYITRLKKKLGICAEELNIRSRGPHDEYAIRSNLAWCNSVTKLVDQLAKETNNGAVSRNIKNVLIEKCLYWKGFL